MLARYQSRIPNLFLWVLFSFFISFCFVSFCFILILLLKADFWCTYQSSWSTQCHSYTATPKWWTPLMLPSLYISWCRILETNIYETTNNDHWRFSQNSPILIDLFIILYNIITYYFVYHINLWWVHKNVSKIKALQINCLSTNTSFLSHILIANFY